MGCGGLLHCFNDYCCCYGCSLLVYEVVVGCGCGIISAVVDIEGCTSYVYAVVATEMAKKVVVS